MSGLPAAWILRSMSNSASAEGVAAPATYWMAAIAPSAARTSAWGGRRTVEMKDAPACTKRLFVQRGHADFDEIIRPDQGVKSHVATA